ncbi:MAG TPA: phosphotransferase [Caulobacteraceae bacterium]
MQWRGDDEILAELTRDAGSGEQLDLADWKSTPLIGGYAGAAVWRIGLRLRSRDGHARTAAYVLKICRAREVATMRTISALGAATFPTVIANRIDSEQPDDPRASLFASPFYPGRDLTFGDAAPAPMLADLARLHARFEHQPRPSWAWRIDADQVARFHADACQALERSERFKTATPDHDDWLGRLRTIASSSPLIAEADDFPASLTHGDVHPGNIIASPSGGHTLIDWGNARWAPAMIDTANMVPLGSSVWAAYLSAYRAAGGSTADAVLLRSWRWAAGITALMYLPWVAEHRDDAARMIAQALEAHGALAASGAGRLP